MVKILFVCHGNICRSPMAEFVMKDPGGKAGLAGNFAIASAATSTEEIGNPVYPPARRKLAEHGISCAGKTARQMTRRIMTAMTCSSGWTTPNLRNMTRICGGDPAGKIHALLDYTGRPGEVAPTPGIPGILRPPGGMCMRAVRRCCAIFYKREDTVMRKLPLAIPALLLAALTACGPLAAPRRRRWPTATRRRRSSPHRHPRRYPLLRRTPAPGWTTRC